MTLPPCVLGLVGVGRWGRHILRDLLALGARVVAVAPSAVTRSFAVENGAERAVPDVSDLPTNVDGIVVCTPTTTHSAVVARSLDFGVPLFCEKPLTDDVDSARRLAEGAPDRLFVMHKWRYHPGIVELARIAASGELGPVVAVRSHRLGWGNPHGDVDGVWMLAPHDISIGLEILGSLPPARAAVAERMDGVVTGIAGQFASLNGGPTFALEVSIAHPIRRREVRLVCERGAAVLGDSYDDHVLVSTGSLQRDVTRSDVRRRVAAEMPLEAELRSFLIHLRGGPPPKSSAAEAVVEVEAVAALRAIAGI